MGHWCLFHGGISPKHDACAVIVPVLGQVNLYSQSSITTGT